MLIYVYLFSLIVGAILLGGSLLLGGHGDADVDADVDVDADADVDAHGDAHAKDVGPTGHGDLSGFLFTFVSLRFWTFFLAFFGLTGLLLDGLDLVGSSGLALAIALTIGVGVGTTAVQLIRKLSGDTSGSVAAKGDYVGKTARVLVPIYQGSAGKVRVEIKGNQVDLIATGLEAEDIEGKEEVLIVEMDGPRARVARLESKKAQS